MAYHLNNPTGRKPGRPPGAAREYVVRITFSSAEVAAVEAAAEAASLPVAAYCRLAAVQSARAQAQAGR